MTLLFPVASIWHTLITNQKVIDKQPETPDVDLPVSIDSDGICADVHRDTDRTLGISGTELLPVST